MYQDLPQKAISIRQPWAWAIVNAGKDIENRTWSTKYRGPVCIHAGVHKNMDDHLGAAMFMQGMDIVAPLFIHMRRGGIIGVADIVDCVDASESPWFFGPYGFVLRNVRPVAFIHVNGALGFFDWRKNLIAARDTGKGE